MPPTYRIVPAGGGGRRFDGASKADVPIGGRRLLDCAVASVRPFVSGRIAVVAPNSVDVPPGVSRTLEDPPAGGLFARIDAGLKALGTSVTPTRVATPAHAAAPANSLRGAPGLAVFADGSAGESSATAQNIVFALTANTPQAGTLAPRLATTARGRDSTITVGGEPPSRQRFRAIYRIEALQATIEEAGGSRNKGVCQTLAGLDPVEVPPPAGECRDVDTPKDVSWWLKALGSVDSGAALRGSGS